MESPQIDLSTASAKDAPPSTPVAFFNEDAAGGSKPRAIAVSTSYLLYSLTKRTNLRILDKVSAQNTSFKKHSADVTDVRFIHFDSNVVASLSPNELIVWFIAMEDEKLVTSVYFTLSTTFTAFTWLSSDSPAPPDALVIRDGKVRVLESSSLMVEALQVGDGKLDGTFAPDVSKAVSLHVMDAATATAKLLAATGARNAGGLCAACDTPRTVAVSPIGNPAKKSVLTADSDVLQVLFFRADVLMCSTATHIHMLKLGGDNSVMATQKIKVFAPDTVMYAAPRSPLVIMASASSKKLASLLLGPNGLEQTGAWAIDEAPNRCAVSSRKMSSGDEEVTAIVISSTSVKIFQMPAVPASAAASMPSPVAPQQAPQPPQPQMVPVVVPVQQQPQQVQPTMLPQNFVPQMMPPIANVMPSPLAQQPTPTHTNIIRNPALSTPGDVETQKLKERLELTLGNTQKMIAMQNQFIAKEQHATMVKLEEHLKMTSQQAVSTVDPREITAKFEALMADKQQKMMLTLLDKLSDIIVDSVADAADAAVSAKTEALVKKAVENQARRGLKEAMQAKLEPVVNNTVRDVLNSIRDVVIERQVKHESKVEEMVRSMKDDAVSAMTGLQGTVHELIAQLEDAHKSENSIAAEVQALQAEVRRLKTGSAAVPSKWGTTKPQQSPETVLSMAEKHITDGNYSHGLQLVLNLGMPSFTDQLLNSGAMKAERDKIIESSEVPISVWAIVVEQLCRALEEGNTLSKLDWIADLGLAHDDLLTNASLPSIVKQSVGAFVEKKDLEPVVRRAARSALKTFA